MRVHMSTTSTVFFFDYCLWMRANIRYKQKAHNDFPAVEPAVLRFTHTHTHSPKAQLLLYYSESAAGTLLGRRKEALCFCVCFCTHEERCKYIFTHLCLCGSDIFNIAYHFIYFYLHSMQWQQVGREIQLKQ